MTNPPIRQSEQIGAQAKSIPAMIIGAFLSAIISGALVIATAKAGISPGVSPLVVLVGWVVFGSFMRGNLKSFLAMLQVTGSGGAAVSAGLIFTAPILQITAQSMGEEVPTVDVMTTLISCLAGSLMGWGFVGLATKRFLTDPRLPAPEAVACDKLIQTAVQNPEERPPVTLSLLPGLLAGFLAHAFAYFKLMSSTALVGKIPIPGFAAANAFKLSIPVSPLFMGIGALLTFPTAILVFSGGLINSATKSFAAENNMSGETYRWVGGAAMVVAVAYSLINYVIEGRRKSANFTGQPSASSVASDDRLLSISKPMRAGLLGAIGVGATMLFWLLSQGSLTVTQIIVLGSVSLMLVGLLSGLGGLLSLQVGASASPVSGTVFMAMLVLSVTAIALAQTGYVAIATLQPVLVACCVAIAAANDSSQDYKTMQLNGFSVSSSFIGQLIGCLVGACTVPFALWIAHEAFTLGSESLPCPQASFFGTVLVSLFDPEQGVPWPTVSFGLMLGFVAVSIEIFGRTRGMILSSLAFAVGIYLPAEMGIGILLGNVARCIGAGSIKKASNRGILAAAGLIAGDSMLSLLAGILIVCRFDMESLMANKPWPATAAPTVLVGMLVFLAFAYLTARNSQQS